MPRTCVGSLHAPLPVLPAFRQFSDYQLSEHTIRHRLIFNTYLEHRSKFRRRAARPAAQPAAWCPLQEPLLWKGTVEQTKSECHSFQDLSAAWKMMILSDGSVTRHLQLMTGTSITADCMEMRDVHAAEPTPAAAELLTAPLLQRQVLLRPAEQPRTSLVYAASWWNRDEGSQLLQDASMPVGAVLRRNRVEVFRDIHSVYMGNCKEFENMFDAQGPMWGREYVFWHNGKPLTVIHEVFSPVLVQFLGSMQGTRHLSMSSREQSPYSNGANSNGASAEL